MEEANIVAANIEARGDIGGESDNGTETSEDKAVLFQPETPPSVPQFGRKQRGYVDQQYPQALAKIKIYQGKVE